MHQNQPRQDPVPPMGGPGPLVAASLFDPDALAGVLEALPVAVAVLEGPEHRFVLANRAFHALAAKGPLVGRTLAEVVPEALDRLTPLLDEVLRTGLPFAGHELELRVDRGRGREDAWFRHALHPHPGQRILVVVEEVTDAVLARRELAAEVDRQASLRELVASLRYTGSREKARSEELQQALAEQQRRRAGVEDLNRALGHDLRTPLATVLVQAQVLRKSSDPAVARRAESIVTGARRMAAMLEDLVDLARLESGQLAFDFRAVDLPALIGDLRERLDGVIPIERVELAIEPALPPLRADAARLERMLVNLLGNALKYSPADRSVRLSAARSAADVELVVEDRGAGISPEDLPRVFDRFFRGAAGGAPGLGLGLYITRQLVEAHGGTIDVESVVGRGSRFRVVLPAG